MMRYDRVEKLIRLAFQMQGRADGLLLDVIGQEFNVSRCTAELATPEGDDETARRLGVLTDTRRAGLEGVYATQSNHHHLFGHYSERSA